MRRRFRRLILIAAACVAAAHACIEQDSPVVIIGDSRVIGAPAGRVAAFLGIPYAVPPTGERRWTAPKPLTKLPVEVDATAFKPACAQGPRIVDWYHGLIADFGGDPNTFPVPAFSEDCLYLNIWTPQPGPGAELPVMVWIHGGAHLAGWAYEPDYNGEHLAEAGVVVVSIPYRLDVLGYFSHPDLEVSNFGLLDQVAALRWVRDNIAAFGGDAANITLFGESAGGVSILQLLAAGGDEPLFARAIVQSGTYRATSSDYRDTFLDHGVRLQELLLGDTASGIAALRQVPADELFAAAAEAYGGYRPSVVADGSSMVAPPGEVLEEQGDLGVDLIIGNNAHEWRMYLDPEASTASVEAWLDRHAPHAREALLELVADEPSPLLALDRLETARIMSCPAMNIAGRVAGAGGSARVYLFSKERGGPQGATLGAYHGAEIPYVFGTHADWLPTNDKDRRLGREIQGRWVAFARTGRPDIEGLPDWPEFDNDRMQVLTLGGDAGEHPDRRLCALLAGTGGG